MAISVATLETRARTRADMVNSSFVTTTEGEQYVRDAYAELWEEVANVFQDWFITMGSSSTLTGGTEALSKFNVTADFGWLLHVEQDPGTTQRRYLSEFNRPNLPSGPIYVPVVGLTPFYRLEGKTIVIEPYESAAGTFRIIYVPTATWDGIGDANDTMDTRLERWAQYVTIRAAIMYLHKEESSTEGLYGELAALKERILIAKEEA